MGNRIVEERNIRSITRNNSGTYSISLPIEYVRGLGWRERQKVVVQVRGDKLVITPALRGK